MTETGTLPDYPTGLTFEQVWAAQMNTDRQMKETDRRMKELQEEMGSLSNRFGEMVEHLVAPNVVGKFNELGFAFRRYAPEVCPCWGIPGNILS